jgi:hypothetical protein
MDSMCIELSLLSSSLEHGLPAGGYVDSWLGSNPVSQVATVCHITYLRYQLDATTNCHITYTRCQLYVAFTSPILGVNYTWHLTIAGPANLVYILVISQARPCFSLAENVDEKSPYLILHI